MTHLNNLIRFLIALSLLTPAFAFAQINATAELRVNANASTTVRAQGGVGIDRAKAKAAEEIERRRQALNAMRARIAAMNKVTVEFKNNLNANVDAQIQALTSLGTKIQGESDTETLKTDVRAITQSYRIFALVMPQSRIAAAADRQATIVNMLASVAGKLQTRIDTAKGEGKDTAALETAMSDMGSKLQSASVHAQAAVTGSATLTPDNGDKAKMESNRAALKAAQEELKAAHTDLTAARKDVETIVKGLRALYPNANAGANASTTLRTP